MSYKPGWEGGRWSAICDVCGFRFHSNDIKKRWDGLEVCKKDWEPRHSLDFIRAKKENIVPPWTRPEQVDDFGNAPTCDLWSNSPIADFGTADCAIVGGNTKVQLLIDTFSPIAIAGIAIAGRSIPGVLK